MSLLARSLRIRVAEAVRDTRLALGWSQRELARRAGVSQSTICRIERGAVDSLTLETAARVLEALGIQASLDIQAPLAADRRLQRDAGHARCVAYVARRLEREGWVVRTETEIVGGRFRGWIDILAYRHGDATLLLIEVKTALPDIGSALRQHAWYEREGWNVARRFGWHPRRMVTALLVLATARNAERMRENRELLRQSFPLAANWLALTVSGREQVVTGGGRATAMIDPYERSARWLLRTPLHGQSVAPRYEDYAALMRRVRGARAA